MLDSFDLSGACSVYEEAQEESDEMEIVREVYQKKFVSKNIQNERKKNHENGDHRRKSPPLTSLIRSYIPIEEIQWRHAKSIAAVRRWLIWRTWWRPSCRVVVFFCHCR